MADKAESSGRPSRAGSDNHQEQGGEGFSGNSRETFVTLVERVEELMGAVEWLKTDQARKGAYQHHDELNELLSSMEKVSRIIEEARKGWSIPLGDHTPAAELPPGQGSEITSLLGEVDRAILSWTGDRAVLKGGEIKRVHDAVKRMEQEVRRGIESFKRV